MQKVISINLNGNVYQLEESGYGALLAYLDRAEGQLRDNPDRAEIIADLEQAIAEKCQRFLGSHKTVVSSGEIAQVIAEMGPVDGGASDNAAPNSDGTDKTREAGAPKRLYQIREGAMLSGVCNGLAAYFDIDVTIVRLIFVVLTFLTSGALIVVYVVLMFVIPYANTSEERAAAQGLPFNAQELIDRAKRNYAHFTDGKAWKWHWKQHTHAWQQQWRQTMRDHRWWGAYVPQPPGYAAQVLAGIMWPVFGIINAALFLLLAFSFFSLGTTGAVLGWTPPPELPLWASLLILVALYRIVTAPLAFMRHASFYAYDRHAWFAVWGGTLWLGSMILFAWLGYRYVPAVHDFLLNLPANLENLSRGTQ